ncbi:MAG: ArsC family reductase [Gammaproteobacteria bacterium]|nr:ArsC family reductase [Gammaproteobacteria bacterium]
MVNAVTLYGIPNCDTIKKAKAWLNDHNVEFIFHDYRKQGLEREQLQSMAAKLGWEAMLNRRGTTWRALPDPLKERIDLQTAIGVMLDNPAIIKRPILAKGNQLHLGFNAAQYEKIFG